MPAEKILAEVIFAMQAAEEIGGPEGSDYLDLMEKIADEASKRRWTYRAIAKASEAKKLAGLLDLACEVIETPSAASDEERGILIDDLAEQRDLLLK